MYMTGSHTGLKLQPAIVQHGRVPIAGAHFAWLCMPVMLCLLGAVNSAKPAPSLFSERSSVQVLHDAAEQRSPQCWGLPSQRRSKRTMYWRKRTGEGSAELSAASKCPAKIAAFLRGTLLGLVKASSEGRTCCRRGRRARAWAQTARS